MKRTFLRLSFLLAALSLTIGLQAQDKPAPSPASKLEQRVGTTDITITYSRPGVKDRTIFSKDGLQPYGEFWRVGANQATKIEFSKDVKVGGEELSAGAYTILAKPGKSEWMVMMYAYEANGWGSYRQKDPDASWTIKPEAMKEMVETFRIDVNNIRDYSADINLEWEKTRITLPIEVK